MLIGNGPTDLNRVSMIGNDLQLDTGIGTCGKNGQGVPVGVGQPTLRMERITSAAQGWLSASNATDVVMPGLVPGIHVFIGSIVARAETPAIGYSPRPKWDGPGRGVLILSFR